MAGKKILMLVGDYAEDYETMVPFPTAKNQGTALCSTPILPASTKRIMTRC